MADPAADDGTRLCPHTEYRTGEAHPTVPRTGADATGVEAAVWSALAEVEDPEMPISIVDLGLVYGVDVADGEARIDLTLTYSGCPAREFILQAVADSATAVEGVETADVNLVWYPPWSVENVTADGRRALEAFGLSV